MATHHKSAFVVCMMAGLTIAGCSSVRTIRKPGDNDGGIRYYRPKPYLLVTPAEPTGRMVNLKLEYLPDFNEEYSIHLRGKASVALKDGWNLVGVNTKEAPAEKAEPPVPPQPMPLPAAVVAATNVPIGYYESIFETSGEKKYLKGWRYVGSTVLGGGRPDTCNLKPSNPNCPNVGMPDGCVNGPLYGMVFFNGVMTFRQLEEIAGNQLCPMFVDPAPNRTPAVDTPPLAPRPGSGVLEPKPTGAAGGVLEPTAPAPTPPPPAPNPGSAAATPTRNYISDQEIDQLVKSVPLPSQMR